LAFEAADCFASALALGLLAFEVGTRGWVHACLRDGDPVQCAVELPVAAAVEPVAAGATRACLERRDAAVTGELRVGVEAVDRADLAQQLGGGEGAAAGKFEQRRRGLGGERCQLAFELADGAAE